MSAPDFLRLAGYFMEFLVTFGPAYLLALIAWRVAR